MSRPSAIYRVTVEILGWLTSPSVVDLDGLLKLPPWQRKAKMATEITRVLATMLSITDDMTRMHLRSIIYEKIVPDPDRDMCYAVNPLTIEAIYGMSHWQRHVNMDRGTYTITFSHICNVPVTSS